MAIGSAGRRTATQILAALIIGAVAVSAPDAQAQPAPSSVTALSNNMFDPATLEVDIGTAVTWTNAGGVHTVTGGDGQVDPKSPIGDLSLPDATTSVTVTFDRPGVYPYFCRPHESLGMKGEIVVAPAGAAEIVTLPSAAPSLAGAPRPDANPSDADPAGLDPGAAPGQSTGPGSSNQEGGVETAGSAPEDNATLRGIEARRAAERGALSGFKALLGAASIALLALCVAVFASTRPRRPGHRGHRGRAGTRPATQ